MISSLLSSVHILSLENITKDNFLTVLRYVSGKYDNLHVLFICDNAPIDKKDILIKEISDSVATTVFNKVSPEPKTIDIHNIIAHTNCIDIDIIVAIGGGSVIDTAKAISMLVVNGGILDEYLGKKPNRKIEKQGIPLIAIPTTAGTGSEVTSVGVYTDQNGRKHSLVSHFLTAHTAILCPSFLDSIPPSLCASTGLDALDHALESIWNKNATVLTRHASEQAAVCILQTLPKLYKAIKNNTKNRKKLQQEMLLASCMAGIAFSKTGTASGHAISFILSEKWHIPHGIACAFTLKEIFKHSCASTETLHSLARIARHFFPAVEERDMLVSKLYSMITKLIIEMDVPQDFKALSVNITDKDIEQYFAAAFSDPKMHNQIPVMTPECLYAILKSKL